MASSPTGGPSYGNSRLRRTRPGLIPGSEGSDAVVLRFCYLGFGTCFELEELFFFAALAFACFCAACLCVAFGDLSPMTRRLRSGTKGVNADHTTILASGPNSFFLVVVLRPRPFLDGRNPKRTSLPFILISYKPHLIFCRSQGDSAPYVITSIGAIACHETRQ